MHKTNSNILIAALGTWEGGAIPDSVRPSLPKVVAKVALTNQTASIPATTLVTPTKSTLYRISVYMVQPFPKSSSCNNPEDSDCPVVVTTFQWTDDGGTQIMTNSPDQVGSINQGPINLALQAASGQGSPACVQTCVPTVATGALPGATFLVRANAGTPLIYSANLAGGGSGVAYDFFMTVEQLE